MKQIVNYIKEGLKVNSKSKIKEDINIKTIGEFAKKYNCKLKNTYSCYASEEIEKSFNYIFSIDSNSDQFAQISLLINKELSKLDYDKHYKYYLKRNKLQKILSIVSDCDEIGICAEIYIKVSDNQYIITLDPYKDDENVQMMLFKLLEYIINYEKIK